MFREEDIITGERLQDLADISISKLEHREFESRNTQYLDVDDPNWNYVDNPKIIYANSSLINEKLKHSELIEKLKKFKNSFFLILHNSDQDFLPKHTYITEIPNLKQIYTQNCNIDIEKITALPIGLANSRWNHGNLETFCSVVNKPVIKTEYIYNNFTVEGGMRPEYRVDCKEAADSLKLPVNKSLNYKDYLLDLQKHKFCLCPSGNGLDTHRLWECLYLRVIPIIVESTYSKNFAKDFPIYLLKEWVDINLEKLDKFFLKTKWENHSLLKFKNYCYKLNLL